MDRDRLSARRAGFISGVDQPARDGQPALGSRTIPTSERLHLGAGAVGELYERHNSSARRVATRVECRSTARTSGDSRGRSSASRLSVCGITQSRLDVARLSTWVHHEDRELALSDGDAHPIIPHGGRLTAPLGPRNRMPRRHARRNDAFNRWERGEPLRQATCENKWFSNGHGGGRSIPRYALRGFKMVDL